MPPLRFRIRTIMLVIALVGVQLGGLIGITRVIGGNLSALVAQTLFFWALVGVTEWRRKRRLTNKAGGIPSGEAERV